MTGFIKGENRNQATLFPERLDDYIIEDNAVRIIDVFIDGIDLFNLGFKTVTAVTGRNLELMWLLGRLAPDFKTIVDFRKNSAKAIRFVCCEFVMICRKLNLFSEAFVAIDGSKFKAVNNRDRNFTRAKIKRRLEDID